ncbi:MAG TPA: hypothetical protein PKA10_16670 [Selenomonadales bacterium]|nr:hypothetical protein [Selenomonadales bacterium]
MKELDELRECLAQLEAGYGSFACGNSESPLQADASLIPIKVKIEMILMKIENLLSQPV